MATYGEWKSSRSWYSYTSKKSMPWALDRRFTAVRFQRAARSRLPCSSSPSCSWVLTDPYPTLLLSRSGTSLPAPRWGSWVSLSSVERRASPLQSGESSARWSAVCSSSGPQEPAQCTRSRRTTAEVDGIDKFHLAAQGLRGRDGALPFQIKNLAI